MEDIGGLLKVSNVSDPTMIRLLNIVTLLQSHEDVGLVHEALSLLDRISKDQISSFHKKSLLSLCQVLLKASTFLQPPFLTSFLSNQFSKIMSSIDLTTLTPLQPIFLMSCYQSGNYELAKQVALAPIYSVENSRETGLTAINAQTHFFYSGLILIRLRSWLRASESFRYCLQVPADTISPIILESFRFFIYTGLLATGSSPQPPRAVSPALRDIDRGDNEQLVIKLASACSRNGALDVGTINHIVNDGGIRGLWKPMEANGRGSYMDWDLMQELVSYANSQRVLRLSNIYSKAPLAEVTLALGLGLSESETVDFVEKMINENLLPSGTYLDRNTGMLVFKQISHSKDNESVLAAEASVAKLNDEVKEVLAVLVNLKSFDTELSSHPILQQLKREKRDHFERG
jgi:hypothetical protein